MQHLLSENQHYENSNRKWWRVWAVLIICVVVAGICVGVFCYFNFVPEVIGELRAAPPIEEEVFSEDVCLTKNCLEATTKILSSLDNSQDPCVDFYQFTCGNFIADTHRKNNLSPRLAQTKADKNRFISDPIRGDEDVHLSLQKRFFQSCLDLTAIDEDESETFIELLDGLGGWPIPKGQNWPENEITLETLLIKCKNLGFSFQWLFEVKFDDTFKELWIDAPKISKPYNESFKDSYKNLMVDTAFTFGASKMLAERESERIINFEKELKEIVFRNKGSPLIHMDAVELYDAFPKFYWVSFINNLTEDANFTISENDTIIIAEDYLRELNLLLAKVPLRVQVNYIIWKIIEDFRYYLSNPFRDNFQNFYNVMIDEEDEDNSRFNFCFKEARTRFPRSPELEFIKTYADIEKSKNIMQMITNIRDHFTMLLESVDWIDDETKEMAISEVNNTVDILSNYKINVDEEAFEKFVNSFNLEFATDNVIHMIREKNFYDFNRQFLLSQMPSLEIDDMSKNLFNIASEVSEGFMEIPNITVLVAGTMIDNLFSEDRPSYLNYAALGNVISHEIAQDFIKKALTHNSTDEGKEENNVEWFVDNVEEIQYENVVNVTKLWRNESVQNLIQRAECLVDDLGHFNDSVNVENILIENFANLIGMNTAYDTYVKWVEENGEGPKLPSLPYTPAQLFWIEFGTRSCFPDSDNGDSIIVEKNHAFWRQQFINVLKNSDNFAKDFECPLGAPMNPEFKCRIF